MRIKTFVLFLSFKYELCMGIRKLRNMHVTRKMAPILSQRHHNTTVKREKILPERKVKNYPTTQEIRLTFSEKLSSLLKPLLPLYLSLQNHSNNLMKKWSHERTYRRIFDMLIDVYLQMSNYE